MSVSLNRRIPAHFWKRRNGEKPLVTPFSMERERSRPAGHIAARYARKFHVARPVIECYGQTTLIILNTIVDVFAYADPNVFV